jgi:GR25 family glycosyltransferase involved in LPS biosynthesis
MSELKAYVINLKSRTDRWASVEAQRSLLGIPIQQVDAIDQDTVDASELNMAAKGVAATWLSHRKAANEFLKSEADFALILEDDFSLSGNFNIPSVSKLKELEADFVQLGYLRVTPWESFDLNIANLRDRALRAIQFLVGMNGFLQQRIGSKLLIRERIGVPTSLVPTDIRPGGHCYVISRNMALGMQNLNNPIVFSADELFVSISRMRAFKMFRVRKSMVSQTNSPTSVDIRFKNS